MAWASRVWIAVSSALAEALAWAAVRVVRVRSGPEQREVRH